MQSRRRIQIFVALTALALVLPACGSEDNTVGPLQPGGTGPGSDPNATKSLQFVLGVGDDGQPCNDLCTVNVSFNATRKLEVQYLENGLPLQGAVIQYTVSGGDAAAASLTARQATTDEGGRAFIEVKAGTQSGQVTIDASVLNVTGVNALRFNVVVSRKGGGDPLIVQVRYNGLRTIDSVELLLFRQRPPTKPHRCESLDIYNLPTADLPIESVVRTSPNLSVTYSSAKFTNLAVDSPQNYTLVVLGYQGQGTQKSSPLVMACIDGTGNQKVEVATGVVHDVTANLADLPSRLCPVGATKCEYHLDNFFDLVSLLPEEVGSPIDIVLGFFDAPASTLLVIACQVDGLEDFCGQFFVDPDDPCTEPGCLESLGNVVFTVLNQLLQGLIEQTLPGTIGLGQDVRMLLTELNLQSTITFTGEPDSSGIINPQHTSEEWHTLRYRWGYSDNCPLNDPTCGWNSIGLAGLLALDTAVSGSFTGRITNDVMLSIDPHDVTIHYGRLLNFLLEQIVLPLLAGDDTVNSYEGFIATLVGGSGCVIGSDVYDKCCENFGQSVANTSNGSTFQSVATEACKAVVGVAGAYLRSQLMDLDIGSGGAFQLSTATPCRLFDDNPRDQIFESLGLSSPDNQRCRWRVSVDVGGGSTEGEADFYGCRDDPCP